MPQTCIARRVEIPWIARAGEHGFLKAIVESDCPAAVYGTPVVRAVLQFKWKAYGMRKFATECIFHCLQLLTFTTFALLYSDMSATSCRDKAPQTIFGSIFHPKDTEQTAEDTKLLVGGIPPRWTCPFLDCLMKWLAACLDLLETGRVVTQC